MDPGPTCGTCERPLVPATLEAIEGTSGATTLRLLGLPVLACPGDHERWPPRAGFGFDLVDALFERGTLPVVVETGFLWFRALRCVACGRDLLNVWPGLAEVTAEIAPAGTDRPVEVTIETEALACPDCGLVQLRGGRQRGAAVIEALADALAGVSIRGW